MPHINGERKSVLLLGPPYRHLKAVNLADPAQPREGGWVMTWNLGSERWRDGEQVVANRFAGLALVIILPDGNDRLSVLRILRLIERTRPQVVLPHHEVPSPREIAGVIRRGGGYSVFVSSKATALDLSSRLPSDRGRGPRCPRLPGW